MTLDALALVVTSAKTLQAVWLMVTCCPAFSWDRADFSSWLQWRHDHPPLIFRWAGIPWHIHKQELAFLWVCLSYASASSSDLIQITKASRSQTPSPAEAGSLLLDKGEEESSSLSKARYLVLWQETGLVWHWVEWNFRNTKLGRSLTCKDVFLFLWKSFSWLVPDS